MSTNTHPRSRRIPSVALSSISLRATRTLIATVATLATTTTACSMWTTTDESGGDEGCVGWQCPVATTPTGATPGATTGATPDSRAGQDAVVGPMGSGSATGVPVGSAGLDAGSSAPDASPLPRPGDGLRFMNWPTQRTRSGATWGSVLTDIANHLPSSYGNQYDDADRITFGHETTHGINSHLRVNFGTSGRRHNGFYLLQDRGVTLEEPGIRKSAVARFVPQALRGSRFGTYITGQTAWDDTPLYVFDEWIAYVNGGEVGVDLVKRNLWGSTWRDGVAGQLEFTAYAIALGMAVEAGDPGYFRQNDQFREFLAWNVRRALAVFREGARMTPFTWAEQDAYHELLRSGADAAPLREFLVRTYGSTFVNEVFAISPL
ncbi:MAG: hypothetical protein U0169_21205 [Polyangiaceae bacterium]